MQKLGQAPLNVGDTVGNYEKHGTVLGAVKRPDGSQFLEINYGTGKTDTAPSRDLLQVARPCWLIANGGPGRIEVLRSVQVNVTGTMYAPVREYIERHDLMRAAQQTFEDSTWVFGAVEMSIYVEPNEKLYGVTHSPLARAILRHYPDWQPPQDRNEWNKCLCPFCGEVEAAVNYDLNGFNCMDCHARGYPDVIGRHAEATKSKSRSAD